jgi:hypothetical protein
MALTREAQQERAAVIKFLRAQLIRRPIGSAEDHFNNCLFEMIADVKAGKHVKAVRSNG